MSNNTFKNHDIIIDESTYQNVEIDSSIGPKIPSSWGISSSDLRYNLNLLCELINRDETKGQLYQYVHIRLINNKSDTTAMKGPGDVYLLKKDDLPIEMALNMLANFDVLPSYSCCNKIRSINGTIPKYFKVDDAKNQPKFPDIVFINYKEDIPTKGVIEFLKTQMSPCYFRLKVTEYVNLWEVLKPYEYFKMMRNHKSLTPLFWMKLLTPKHLALDDNKGEGEWHVSKILKIHELTNDYKMGNRYTCDVNGECLMIVKARSKLERFGSFKDQDLPCYSTDSSMSDIEEFEDLSLHL